MKFLAALQFLTAIPIPSRRELTPEDAGGSTAYFPAVGFILGLLLAGWNWLLNAVFPPAVVGALLVVSLAMLTGALHLDGFLDTCDGLAGHHTVEDRWRIMHDSRAGGIGVVGVVLVLLLKYVALTNVPRPLLMTTLIFMPVVSRWAMVYAIFAYPYARTSGLGKVYKEQTGWARFAAATLITLAVAIMLLPLIRLSSLVIIVGVWLMTVVVAAYFKRKFSGLTGDTYGAINEIGEVNVLLLVIVLARFGLA